MALIRYLIARFLRTETDAFYDGSESYDHGDCEEHNPYPRGTWQHRDWRRGFYRAAGEDDA